MLAIVGCSTKRKVIGPPGLAAMFRHSRCSSSVDRPYQRRSSAAKPSSNASATRASKISFFDAASVIALSRGGRR